jgi:hypothetical protein
LCTWGRRKEKRKRKEEGKKEKEKEKGKMGKFSELGNFWKEK